MRNTIECIGNVEIYYIHNTPRFFNKRFNQFSHQFLNLCVYSCIKSPLSPKKIFFFSEISRMKIVLSLTSPHSRMCIKIYIWDKLSNVYQNIYMRQKKETINEEKRISMENRTGYDDIVWEFTLSTFNLPDLTFNLFSPGCSHEFNLLWSQYLLNYSNIRSKLFQEQK